MFLGLENDASRYVSVASRDVHTAVTAVTSVALESLTEARSMRN